MTEYPARRDPKRPPMHPGALLREDVLPASIRLGEMVSRKR
jgi:hypothetical protein